MILTPDQIKSNRNSYTRTLFSHHIFHNNRCDMIKQLLYKEQNIIEKNIDDIMAMNFNNSSENYNFPTDVEVESFKILELLGKGSFGEVYLVELLTTGKKYAMKVLNKNKIFSQNIVRYVVTERNVLSNIKHPYIVQLYFAFQTDDFLYLILEYCEGKDLCYHLRKNKFFDEEKVRIISAQLLLAVEELHKNNIIYRYIFNLI